MTIDFTKITFADFEEPDDELCELIFAGLSDSVITYSSSFRDGDDIDGLAEVLEEIHIFIDSFVLLLSDIYPNAAMIQYLLSHDGHQFVFSPGNLFTCKVSSKMDQIQTEPVFRFNVTI